MGVIWPASFELTEEEREMLRANDRKRLAEAARTETTQTTKVSTGEYVMDFKQELKKPIGER